VEWILLTNDDGVFAPALISLAHALSRLAPVRVVVPDKERSWTSKAITRFEPVRVEVLHIDGVEIHAASGYPADCAQLGIHTIFDEPPVLVVSGINVGYNHGQAYLQSSGTVGAALEASISGVDAVALSTASRTRPWAEWRAYALGPDSGDMWDRLAGIATAIVAPVLVRAPQGVLLNVNMPDFAGPATPRRLTTLADVGYERLFRRAGPGEYVHDYGGGLRNFASLEGTDVQAAIDGLVSITPIRGTHTSDLPEDLRAELVG
jgi:5'-nucleotidase